nr:hypothetical protein [Gammaproteobacteria bacterium]
STLTINNTLHCEFKVINIEHPDIQPIKSALRVILVNLESFVFTGFLFILLELDHVYFGVSGWYFIYV